MIFLPAAPLVCRLMCTKYQRIIRVYFRFLVQLSYLAWRCSNNGINVKACPNPTGHQFSLVVEGGSNEKISVVVYDVLGRRVKHIEKSNGQLIRFGEELKVGAYIAEVRQGNNRKTVKLIKQ